ncbi:MAG: NAD(+)--dinitrogen-reductase ADP-D-ribosyltransferase [Azoarcus sp.]|nr:NAD(+)--dinitrogen-reductase ADP-D-ribosyltransferase [Azoarcus sp.]
MKENTPDTPGSSGDALCDKTPTFCRADNIHVGIPARLARLTIPAAGRRPLNRANLPPEALASFAFQLAPCALELDGVLPLHRPLFDRLAGLNQAPARAQLFRTYMNAHFQLDNPGALGFSASARIDRSRLDYLRLLRGWLFNAESREGAILKAWVESRFGLLTRFHRGPVGDSGTASRIAFEREAGAGLYTTGALEAQIDLLYAWSQHELARHGDAPGQSTPHLTLYRGLSGARTLPGAPALEDGRHLIELNNLSSFSASRERADEFGDVVVSCAIPREKILAFTGLLPGLLQGEEEFLVIGGVVAARREC